MDLFEIMKRLSITMRCPIVLDPTEEKAHLQGHNYCLDLELNNEPGSQVFRYSDKLASMMVVPNPDTLYYSSKDQYFSAAKARLIAHDTKLGTALLNTFEQSIGETKVAQVPLDKFADDLYMFLFKHMMD